MTDGEVSASGDAHAPAPRPDDGPGTTTSLAGNIAGQGAILEFLRVQSAVPARSALARIFGVSPLVPESRTWFEAATSEMAVGDELARLDADWLVLHALPVGVSTDIDHVVVGPGGVYIINTKSHPGQAVWVSQRAFLVAGMRYPYIRNMEYEMGRAERLLGSAAGSAVEVAGILVVVSARSITVRDEHRDVTVLPTSAVAQWLRERPVLLSADDVERIGAAARLDSTWYRGARPAGDRAQLRERFAAYRSEVRRAWRLQVIWAAGTTVAGAGGFVAVTYAILVSALASLSAQ
jgi:hypothetical protein